ncbi:glycosyl hydrolase [Dysgonomonas sp. 520]|uniref:glycosyl hydrolase n=1 Tax=Dysgonomonas sp. 520 TaxID=2302931 RepID=UPI0013D82A5D|nr:glycosyl hydrolase [Dysgonomonas sp. 520]
MMKKFILILAAIALGFSCSDDDKDNDNGSGVGKDPVTQGKSQKRGVSFNFQVLEDITLLAPAISWSYNWGPDQSASYSEPFKNNNIDYFPMAWNGGYSPSRIRAYKAAHPECKYILAFNEPNLTDQANMTPQKAAEYWPAFRALATELGMKIISPAMNYGTLAGYSDPIKWLDEFFTLVPLSDIDGISIHCYMTNPSATKSYIERFKKYGKPIWMTEFCAWEGATVSPDGQMKYMCDIINYMECDPDIERYAWFIPRLAKGEKKPYMELLERSLPSRLTAIGEVFVNMSTLDKNTYYVEGQTIEAEHYNSISISESVGSNGWVSGPSMRLTTDGSGGTLELCNFYTNQWVEYQVEVSKKKQYKVDIRYATFTDSEFEVEVDGKSAGTISLPSTGEDYIWKTETSDLQLGKGKHKIRLKLAKGIVHMNWLKIY